MTVQQGSLVVGIVGAIFIPMMFAVLRLTVKWTKVQEALTRVSERIDVLIKDKDKAHMELASAMREDRKTITDQLTFDRAATDRRLRWLEERLWLEKGKH